jgi:hypothetical protein
LKVYSAIRGEFKEGWIPDDFYGVVVVPRINGEYGEAVDLKGLTGRFLDHPALPDRVRLINGRFFDAEYRLLPDDALLGAVFGDDDRAVFKEDGPGQGKGVSLVRRDAFDPAAFRSRRGGAFQRFVRQHASLASFNTAVATLRLTTTVDDRGSAELRAAYLRFDTGDDPILRSATSVKVPVLLDSGTLSASGYGSTFHRHEHHPTTGIPFSGFEIPSFADARALCLALHERVAFLGCVGWDVTVDEHGMVVLLEANTGHNGIVTSEAVQGPCFSGLGWELLTDTDD